MTGGLIRVGTVGAAGTVASDLILQALDEAVLLLQFSGQPERRRRKRKKTTTALTQGIHQSHVKE